LQILTIIDKFIKLLLVVSFYAFVGDYPLEPFCFWAVPSVCDRVLKVCEQDILLVSFANVTT